MSFNPKTGLVYIPATFLNSSTYTVNPTAFVYKEGGRNTGIGRGNAPEPTATDVHPDAAPVKPIEPFIPPIVGPNDGTRGGVLIAWDPVTQTERWRREGGGASGGGTLTTASNLLFQVVPDGRLVIYSADKGEKLHEIDTGLHLGMGPPVTYTVGGKQYVTVTGGRGVVTPPPGAPAGGTAAAGGGTGGPTPGAATAPAAPAGGGGAPVYNGPPVPPRMLTFAIEGGAQ